MTERYTMFDQGGSFISLDAFPPEIMEGMKPMWDSTPRTKRELAKAWRVRRTLELMPYPAQRDVLERYFFLGESIREIAHARGTSHPPVVRLLKRAMRTFERTMVEHAEELKNVPEEEVENA